MITIIKARRQGKTHDIIELSEQLQIPIIAPTVRDVENITNMAKANNKNIPKPILCSGNNLRTYNGDVLVDDMPRCGMVTQFNHINIVGYSANHEDVYSLRSMCDSRDVTIQHLKREIEQLKSKLKETQNELKFKEKQDVSK